MMHQHPLKKLNKNLIRTGKRKGKKKDLILAIAEEELVWHIDRRQSALLTHSQLLKEVAAC